MVPLGAEILTERVSEDGRAAVRRSLNLGVQTHTSGEVAMALVLNISESGLLVETVVDLAAGEILRVDIPVAGASVARVVWTDGLRAGCVFIEPISSAAVSAARLRAPGVSQQGANDGLRSNVDRDSAGATLERTIVLICATLAAVALIVFLAAILPL